MSTKVKLLTIKRLCDYISQSIELYNVATNENIKSLYLKKVDVYCSRLKELI